MSLVNIDPCSYQFDMPMILASLITNANGRGKIRMMEVPETDDDYFDCTMVPPSTEELINLISDFNSDGERAIRFAKHTDCAAGNDFVTCANNAMTIESVGRSVIGKSADGKGYLRICMEELP